MRIKPLAVLAAALMIGAAPLANAEELIVYHGWSSKAEVAALNVLQGGLNDKGHTWKDLAIPHNISLLKLPPYAPELNPVENVWEYLRKNKLAQRLYADYRAIVDACCQAWNDFLADPARVTSVSRRAWAQVS